LISAHEEIQRKGWCRGGVWKGSICRRISWKVGFFERRDEIVQYEC
jgi:hypothetical protein